MANVKNTKQPAKQSPEDAMARVSALIAKAKKEGSIQATELTAQLERFARDGEALLSGLLEKASDIDGVRRALLSHAMLVLGESEAKAS